MQSRPKIVLGMSGGVDSSVAVHLLKEQGYDVIGVHMRHIDTNSDIKDVLEVARTFNITCHIIDYTKKFSDIVIEKTKLDMENGLTPNPCCFCNREVKFKMLCDFADSIGVDYIATGHYCRVVDAKLVRGVDPLKDQTYFLSGITKEQLSRAIFPLGELTKPQVRELANKLGLRVSNKPDSLDICFNLPYKNYTIGQRINQGGNKQRMYFLGDGQIGSYDDPRLYSKSLVAKNFNWLGDYKENCTAKTRGKQPDQECVVQKIGNGIKVIFASPQRAVTLGQWVVLYDGEVCLGGGEITEAYRD